MTENTAGDGTPEQDPARIAANLRQGAAKYNADLGDPLTLAGYMAAAAAVLTHAATVLPDGERRVYAENMLALVDALAVDQPPFNAGWNALLAANDTIAKRAVTAGQLSEPSRQLLFDAAARLLHQD